MTSDWSLCPFPAFLVCCHGNQVVLHPFNGIGWPGDVVSEDPGLALGEDPITIMTWSGAIRPRRVPPF